MSLATLVFSLVALLRPPFASVDEAASLMERGALVLDARPKRAFTDGHLPRAVHIDWQDYRDGIGRTGRLSDDDRALARDLGALGVDDQRPILVYGSGTAGFGEEGRIVWMLSYLGHKQIQLLDGGYAAWSAAGRAIERGDGAVPRTGGFTPVRRPELRAELASVARASQEHVTVVDTRTIEEWKGATPHFEARGGHIPGARLLPWTTLFDARGALLPRVELLRRVTAAGIAPGRPVILYCTGGVRAALSWAVLRSLGYDAKNFDASFWEWARHADLPVETGLPVGSVEAR